MRQFITEYRHAFRQCTAFEVAHSSLAYIIAGCLGLTWAALSPLIAVYGALRPTGFFLLLRWLRDQ